MLASIEADIAQLSLPQTWRFEPLDSFDRLNVIEKITPSLNYIDVVDEQKEQLQTDFGRRLHTLKQEGIRFGQNGLVCCCHTEAYLYKSLHSVNDRGGYRVGPLLLVMDGSEVVGVQKNMGEPSVYPIAERPAMGLYVGTIAAPTRRVRPAVVSEDKSAVVAVPIEEYSSFTPSRLSSTAIDQPVRRQLARAWLAKREISNFEACGLLLSHENVTTKALAKQREAIPFHASMLTTEPEQI